MPIKEFLAQTYESNRPIMFWGVGCDIIINFIIALSEQNLIYNILTTFLLNELLNWKRSPLYSKGFHSCLFIFKLTANIAAYLFLNNLLLKCRVKNHV